MTSEDRPYVTSYDEVSYDSEANAETHPIAMATLATYAGLEGVASAKRARVLEIGCGDGTNLIRMARYLPDASFVGFDLAKTAIEAGKKSAPANVRLFDADIMNVKLEAGAFDYVIAHGMVSWVPEVVRKKLFALMSETLAERGVGFVSVNALPGWELRRALREVALQATRGIEDPAKKVRAGLEAIAKLTKQKWGESTFGAGLSKAAAEYLDHVKEATPASAPYSRYVFHDLLAEVNVPFTKEALSAELESEGMHVLSETPLGAKAESPFLQLLVSKTKPTKERGALADLYLWADFAKTGRAGEYKTTTGAVVRPVGEEGLATAVSSAPGFVKVRELSSDLNQFSLQLEAGWREGVFTLVSEPPEIPEKLVAAIEPVMTNPLHRSYKLSPKELESLREDRPSEELRDRLRRHLFLR